MEERRHEVPIMRDQLDRLQRATAQLIEHVKDEACQSIAKHLPRRLMYFIVIRATAIYTQANPTLEVPSATAMDVATGVWPL